MSKLLILVRHGKAQSRDLGYKDFDRELTGVGKRALKDWLVKSRWLLAQEEAATYELWSSPAARAMQTARVVSKVWGKRLQGFPQKPMPVEVLWSGEMSAVIDAFDRSSADAVVVCGHNPSIEMLCAELTGCNISFATGGIAALRVDEGNSPYRARLLWFVQGPESKNWKQRR